MNYASKYRKATESQIGLIMKLAGTDSVQDIINRDGMPYRVRIIDAPSIAELTSRDAATIIQSLMAMQMVAA